MPEDDSHSGGTGLAMMNLLRQAQRLAAGFVEPHYVHASEMLAPLPGANIAWCTITRGSANPTRNHLCLPAHFEYKKNNQRALILRIAPHGLVSCDPRIALERVSESFREAEMDQSASRMRKNAIIEK
ncbi:hypothetical protein An16g02780 [Aspergillus niger]|uniref:Uncharacterized protein n=2 Tax=Aspergillus niger TaxID=5061 RepID=A2R799_ASPNC|nr:hypothetical protein An16g02780 [Aspergillus niger]CAK48588.1 hypothetical protein An16g02780 [Aspergillus niger]